MCVFLELLSPIQSCNTFRGKFSTPQGVKETETLTDQENFSNYHERQMSIASSSVQPSHDLSTLDMCGQSVDCHDKVAKHVLP